MTDPAAAGPGAAADAVAAATDGAATATDAFGRTTLDVPATAWRAAATAVRDAGWAFFDWLSAYDDRDEGLAVVLHAWSVEQRSSVLLRTRVPRDAPTLESVTQVWSGADWHERETFEMFGVTFDGHPHLVSLLLPEGFEGNPLRKEFVLASRVAKAWPGAKEPGESDHDLLDADGNPRPRRRTIQPPGVPEPGTWGPEG